jgi:hypothetical protein
MTRSIFVKEESMSRQNMIVVALGTVVLAAWPLAHASAQSGDALAHAENTCAARGVTPNTAAFETCVDRAAWAFQQGQPVAAGQQAALVRDANDLCTSYGIAPQSLGYRQCVNSEIDRRSSPRAMRDVPRETPHRVAAIDSFGFRYDSEGNLIDRDGYPIRAVP